MAQWSEELGIKLSTLFARLKYYKWPIEKAFTTPCRLPKGK